MPDRELIVRGVPVTATVSTSTIAISYANTMTCSKCATFEKSGRVSCCAPGGAWYKNCEGAGSRGVDYKWSEGVQVCKCKFKAKGM